MARYRLSAAAQADILNILAWTDEQFGEVARKRYEALIAAGLRDVASAPNQAGSAERPELGDGVRSWHLRLSRERGRTATGIVRNPRHLLIYQPGLDAVLIARVLHDAMELVRHLPE